MSDNKKKSSWLWTLSKITFFVAAFLIIIFTVMANMGGNSDTLKGIIEEYASEATGYTAKIETLNDLNFFPSVRIDIQNLKLYEKQAAANGDEAKPPEPLGDPVATLESARLTASFWDVAFSTGRIKDVQIKNFSAKQGAFGDKTLRLEQLELIKDSDPKLSGQGAYGQDSFSLSASMNQDGDEYSFAANKGMEISAGPIRISGKLEELGDFKVTDLQIYDTQNQNIQIISGQIEVEREDDQTFEINADLNISNETASHLKIDVTLNTGVQPMSLSGAITSDQFHLNDFDEDSDLIKFVNHVQDFLDRQKPETTDTQSGLDLSFATLDINTNLKNIIIDAAPLAAWKGNIALKDAKLDIKTQSGQFSNGDLKLVAVLDTKATPHHFQKTLSITDIDIGALHESVLGDTDFSGSGDVRMDLKSQGQTLEALKANMNGKFAMLIGESNIESKLLDLWGGGLVNAIIPDFSSDEELGLNCGVADFVITDGLAESRAVFFDFKRLTLQAKGTYDIAADELDMKIKPKPKAAALGDISTSVNISGSLTEPSFSPSLVDLGLKIGGLVLGAANPVALAFTLTDLGLTENHPCHKYIQSDGNRVDELPETQKDTGNPIEDILPDVPF